MSSGAGPAGTLRYLHRIRRMHELADRPARDPGTLLRKARAVLMLRARRFASEARWQVTEAGQMHYRSAAIRELRAARLAHRLVMEHRAATAIRFNLEKL